MNEGDTPGLIARPPLIYLGSMVAGLVLQRLWPVAVVPAAWEVLLGPQPSRNADPERSTDYAARYLERKFGDEYVRYKAAVRRWF